MPERLHRGRWAAALAPLALLVAIDAFWIEPHRLLFRDDVALPLDGAANLRVAHLSDLHVASVRPLTRRLLAEVAAARPDLVVVSGDLVQDVPEPARMARHTRAVAAVVGELRRTAPVVGVQGHSEHQGPLVAALADAGLVWLANEGRWLPGRGGRGGVLLLGLTQQVGEDGVFAPRRTPFAPLRHAGGWLYGSETGKATRNDYSHYDPGPAGLPKTPGTGAGRYDGWPGRTPSRLEDVSGPLSWSGYDLVCDTWIERPRTGAGVTVHSRYVVGEDRMIRLRRAEPVRGMPGTFALAAHGTAFTAGAIDTGVEPEPRRWYRLRLRTRVEPGVVRVWARVWPAGEPEPRRWQAWAEDRSRHRVTAGTVGLWSWGGGIVLYRDLRVTAADGRVLLAAPLAGREAPAGWRTGARGTRLALALARSPRPPPRPGEGVLGVLSHTPDVALEAARMGVDFVLAGHTHGGQVAVPFHGAIITRSKLGAFYDRGRFAFAASNRRGWTWVYVNPGFGTSILPIRFWCPPRWALVELR